MGKRVEHQISVTVEGGLCQGTIVIQHGSLKHNKESVGQPVKWTCDVSGEQLDTLLGEAGRNISVRMATMRELPFEEFVEKRKQLNGAVVDYKDISGWTTKGGRGRTRFEDMSADELLAKMTPKQLEAMRAKLGL